MEIVNTDTTESLALSLELLKLIQKTYSNIQNKRSGSYEHLHLCMLIIRAAAPLDGSSDLVLKRTKYVHNFYRLRSMIVHSVSYVGYERIFHMLQKCLIKTIEFVEMELEARDKVSDRIEGAVDDDIRQVTDETDGLCMNKSRD